MSDEKTTAWGKEYILLEDAAGILGISTRTLYNHKKDGELEFQKFAGKNYVTLPSILRYFGRSVWEFKIKSWTYNESTCRYARADAVPESPNLRERPERT